LIRAARKGADRSGHGTLGRSGIWQNIKASTRYVVTGNETACILL
jgi:hypothetical protein